MKIVVTSPYPLWPPYTGAAVRTYQIALALKELGHEVHVVSCGPVAKEETSLNWHSFSSTNRAHHFWNPSFRNALNQLLTTGADLLLLSYPYQAAMVISLAKKYRVPVVYDAQNVEADRFQHLGRKWVGKLVAHMEKKLTTFSKAVVCVSQPDKARLKSLYSVEPLLLPNGINPLQFFPGPASSTLIDRYDLCGKKILLFFGTFQYDANLKAAQFLVEKTWPLVLDRYPETRLLLVGTHPPDFAKEVPGIIVTDAVPDIAAHIRLAHFVVCPLPATGGTRLKILEALACGTEVLATPEAALGIPSSTPGLEVVQLRDFNARLLRLLETSALKRYNTAASRFAESYYWSPLVQSIPWETFRV